MKMIGKKSYRTLWLTTSVEVMATEEFFSVWRQLTSRMKNIVNQKISLLEMDRRHPSLRVHRLRHGNGDMWICYITNTMRLLYSVEDGVLYLHGLGGHAIVDKAHVHRSAS